MDWRKVQIQTLILAISLSGWPWNANAAGVRSLNVIPGRGMSLVSTAGLPLDTCTPCSVRIPHMDSSCRLSEKEFQWKTKGTHWRMYSQLIFKAAQWAQVDPSLSQCVTDCSQGSFLGFFPLSPALYIHISTFQLVYLPPCGEICSKLSIHCTSTQQNVQEIIYYCSLLDPAHICTIISLPPDGDRVSFGAFGLLWKMVSSLQPIDTFECASFGTVFFLLPTNPIGKRHKPTAHKVKAC